jgi:hypothetical protein
MKTIYQQYALGLELSHRALERNLDHFAELASGGGAPPADLGPFLALYCEFLAVHHHGEDDHLFPALRRNAAGRSSDVAHLDRWDGEHREIERLGRELERLAGRVELGALGRRSADLRALLTPHTRDEEQTLTAAHLAEMISDRELTTALDGIQRAMKPRALAMASFLATSLDPDEQRALMGDAPWIFRKVILPVVGGRKMKRFRGLVRTPEIAL